jgi:hypothetical protein
MTCVLKENRLLGTVIAQNATDFNATLYSIVGPDIPEAWPPLVEKSGLWNNGTEPINACKLD